VAAGQLRVWLRGHTGDVTGIAFLKGGDRLVSVSRDSTLRLWDVATGKQVCKRETGVEWSFDVHPLPDGKTVAVGVEDRSVTKVDLWDLNGGPSRRVPGTSDDLMGFDVSRDGTSLAVAEGAYVVLRDLATGKELAKLASQAGQRFFKVTFAPDGKRLAA